jgi:hypothetical protein
MIVLSGYNILQYSVKIIVLIILMIAIWNSAVGLIISYKSKKINKLYNYKKSFVEADS